MSALGGNDSTVNSAKNVTIQAGAGNDTIDNNGNNNFLNGGAGNDSIYSYGINNSINGGAGSDKISLASATWSNTIKGGKGNDTIYGNNRASTYGHIYQYAKGDGNDVIYNVGTADTLSISGATYSTVKSGSDVLVSVTGSGTIKLKNFAGNSIHILGKAANQNTWKLNGTTATYGTSSKTLITVKNVKSLDGISLNEDNKVVTLAESSLNEKKVTISGDGYTLALADDVSKSKTTAAGWTVSGTTATYKTKKITAGYTLASNKKSISHTKASGGATKITLSGLKSGTKASYLTLKNNVVTISKNAIGSGKITAKGDGYTFVLGSSGKLTYAGSNATLKGSTGKDSIAGGSKSDTIYGGKGNDTLTGGKGNDILTGGEGNDILTGGEGSDVFVYNKGDGNDKILDYTDEDLISIKGDKVTGITTKGNNAVLELASKGKISLVGGDYDVISYSDSNGEHSYFRNIERFVNFKSGGKIANLKSNYSKETFDSIDYSKYAGKLTTINAAAVEHGMDIVGNSKANSIVGTADDDTIDGGTGKDILRGGNGNDLLYGGAGSDCLIGGEGTDTLIGGKGNDCLTGGEGSDVFVYNLGDGNDTIFGYDSSVDKIILTSGSVDNVTPDDNKNVIFTIGKGQIVLDNAKSQYAAILDTSGRPLNPQYIPH